MPIDETPDIAPAQVAFPTFLRFIEKLADSVVPSAIDRSVMGRMSGSSQTYLLGSLRFLGLVGPEGESTPALEEFVDARRNGAEDWQAELRDVVDRAYSPTLRGVNRETGTASELKKAMKEVGKVPPSGIDQAVRFFLSAAAEAGMGVSPHFKDRAPRSGKPKRLKRKRLPATKKVEVDERELKNKRGGNDEDPPAGLMEIPVFIPGKPTGYLQVPADLEEADCVMIDTMLRALAARIGAAKEGQS